jgi:tyrosyl-tRNA synthetase
MEDIEAIPTYSMTSDELGEGIQAYILFKDSDLCATRSEARRLISQGGAYVNGGRIPSFDTRVGPDDIQNNAILLRAGKKKYLRVCIQDS